MDAETLLFSSYSSLFIVNEFSEGGSEWVSKVGWLPVLAAASEAAYSGAILMLHAINCWQLNSFSAALAGGWQDISEYTVPFL